MSIQTLLKSEFSGGGGSAKTTNAIDIMVRKIIRGREHDSLYYRGKQDKNLTLRGK